MVSVIIRRYLALAKGICQREWFPSFALLMVMMGTLMVAMFAFMLLPVSSGGKIDGQGAAKKAVARPPVQEDAKATYALPELITNIGDAANSRFVVANLTLVGIQKSFAEDNEAKIMDLSSGILSRLKPDVIEQPLNRKMIKTELLTEMQRVLGGSFVKDIYFTRLAIQ